MKLIFKKIYIQLPLTNSRSRIRICDANGNHERKPTVTYNSSEYYVEWMITNKEIKKLINKYLNENDKNRLVTEINDINRYVKNSEYSQRKSRKLKIIKKDKGFKVIKNREEFFSLEKRNIRNITFRISFKIGDFSLNPHLYILLPFTNKYISIMDKQNTLIEQDRTLGSKAIARWEIDKNDIRDVVLSITKLSQDHKKFMQSFL